MCCNPITIKVDKSVNNDNFRCILVPCGKCPICIQKYQNSWKIRLYEEFKDWTKATFLTLTYRDEAVPKLVNTSTGEYHLTVYKQHIKDWFKKFRTYYFRLYGKPPSFKYFLCSEYGPTTFRPHYHGIIFGLSPEELSLAIVDWTSKYGFVTAESIDLSTDKSRHNSSRYVSKYCNKGVFESIYEKLGLVSRTFRLMSKGIGKSYVDRNKNFILNTRLSDSRLDDIKDKLKYNLNGTLYSLPRYFKDKILRPKSFLRTQVADYILKDNDKVYLSELSKLQSTMSEAEAVNTLAMQEVDVLRRRVADITERQNKFYKKSKI